MGKVHSVGTLSQLTNKLRAIGRLFKKNLRMRRALDPPLDVSLDIFSSRRQINLCRSKKRMWTSDALRLSCEKDANLCSRQRIEQRGELIAVLILVQAIKYQKHPVKLLCRVNDCSR